ncbi:J domain-containing protein [Xanthomonas bonasiae]|uniref:J domain-containing protein n=1 Tax=Xanthomonas bonasiae TaxID=2810351 RepID=UPI001784360D|nr:J domain-containing protein [Xanthomonas surreyensis]MBD7923846.1 J domain-containing protein [Xanthomonas surreyensis]
MNRTQLAALERLGVAQDADESAIKRAYARLLKLHRPDTDPAGFQALHEAYQHALAWRRQSGGSVEPRDAVAVIQAPAVLEQAPPPRDAMGEVPLPLAPSPPAPPRAQAPREMPLPAAPPPREAPCDPHAVALEVVSHAVDGTAAALQHWLEQHPVMWSLGDKVRVGQAAFGLLEQEPRPIENTRFDVLQRFFEWDAIGGNVHPLQLEDVRHKAHVSWKLNSPASNNAHSWRLNKDLQHLSRPFKWRSALFNALPMGEADRICSLLDITLAVPDGTPVPPIDERNQEFWRAAADPSRFTLDRTMVYAARCVLVTAIFSTLVVPILVIRAAPSTLLDVALHAVLAWLYVSAAVVACAAAVELCQWQMLPDAAVRHGRWAHRLCIPILSVTTLLLADKLWWPFAWGLAITLLIASCIRGFYRHYLHPFHQPVWRAAPFLLLACFVSVNSRVIEIPLVVAMLYWLLDVGRQVVRQRKRLARSA